MSEDKFDTRTAAEKLQTHLSKYLANEELKYYDEDCYIKDMLFFIGLSIDTKDYNFGQGFRKFVAKKIAPNAEGIAKSEFKRNLKGKY